MEEKKTNKRSRAVIIAAMLLLLIGIVCLCGVTFAKYITSVDKPTQQATVAKWGYIVNADTSKLYGTDYSKGNIITSDDTTNPTIDVQSVAETQVEVVAPGTEGYMTFGVSGTAEVLAKLSFEMTVKSEISLSDGDENTDDYYPIVWTLTKVATKDGETDSVLKSGTLTEIKTTLDAIDETIDPGDNIEYTYKLSWKWEFHVDDATDKLDTLLGYAAAGDSDQYEDGKVAVATTGGVTKVTDSTVITETVTDPNEYTAVTTIEFSLKITVQQIQAA